MNGSVNESDSAENMQTLAKGAKVEGGKRLGRNASASELKNWAEKYL